MQNCAHKMTRQSAKVELKSELEAECEDSGEPGPLWLLQPQSLKVQLPKGEEASHGGIKTGMKT